MKNGETFGNWKGTKEFLNLSRSFGLMLNLDWFQPFKHRIDCKQSLFLSSVSHTHERALNGKAARREK